MSTFESQHELRVGFRGYERAATDAFLAALDQRNTMLGRERDDLRAQVEELVRELEQHRGRSQAVADALVTAQVVATDLRTTAEVEIEERRREVAEAKQALVDEGAAIRADARREATEIVREARIRADRLIEQVFAALEEYQRDTDQFLSGTRERLGSLVREVLGRIPGSAQDYVPVSAEETADATAAA